MKINKIVIVSVITGLFIFNINFGQTRFSKKNVEKFILSAYTSTIDNSDSLRISIFMELPYSSLQYIKQDSQFIARYEASIALQINKGIQLGREVWNDSITVDDYTNTRSISKNRTLMASYKIPAGKYKIVGTLMDKDTKKVGKNSIELDMSDYKRKRFLHKPILLEKFNGNWGFGKNYIPAINNRSYNFENGLLFYLTGKVTKGKYKLKIKYFDKSDDLIFEETIEDTSQSGYFQKLVKLPNRNIQGLKIKMEVELAQKTSRIEKSTKILLRKAGISHLVEDVDEALDQMRYILNSKERKRVRKTSSIKSEDLFRELWEVRDPTPGTTVNELMNEYYKRVNFANNQFSGFREGWETDMGMVYIILGPPDDIERYIDNQYQEPYEAWHYYRIQETYIFIGDNFGNYTLLTPFFGYR